MNEAERQTFLAGVHVGVLAVERPDGPPLSVPIWYDYEPGGDLWVLTSPSSRKGKLLERARRFSLCVQRSEAPGYAYVSVEGPVVAVEPADVEQHRRPMAHRYLGPELGDAFVESIEPDSQVWTMRPERWWSVDYRKLEPPGGAGAS